MMVRPLRRVTRFCLLLLIIFTFAGCAGGRVEVQSGRGQAGPGGDNGSSAARGQLVARQAGVKWLRAGTVTDLSPGETVNIQAGDQAAVSTGGRGLLIFPGDVTVDLVGGTNVEIGEAQASTGNARVPNVKQLSGTTHVQVNNDGERIVVATDQGTVRAPAGDGEFLVCQAQGMGTCVVALAGKVRVDAGGQQVDLEAGQGTTIAQGKPGSPVCADLSLAGRWMDGSDALRQAVARGPQPPCAGAPAGAPAAAATVRGVAAATAPAGTATPGSGRPSGQAASTTAAPAASATTVGSAAANATAAIPATGSPKGLPSKDGMVRIPEGSYTVGGPTEDPYHTAAQTVQLKAFWIDQYPATNAQYKAFLDKTGQRAPASWANGTYPTGKDKYPAQGLAWDDARAFCEAQNKRLPAEAEWEAAGRGSGANPPHYPWGDDPAAGGKTNLLPETNTYEVGTQSFNKSPAGVYDMVGTVWQWVDTPYGPVAEGMKVLHGGRFGLVLDLAYRLPVQPENPRYSALAGVRCAAAHTAGE